MLFINKHQQQTTQTKRIFKKMYFTKTECQERYFNKENDDDDDYDPLSVFTDGPDINDDP